MRGLDVRKATLAARAAQVDPDLLPKTRTQMTWARVPAAEGGGRLGVVEGDWWLGQVRVLRERRHVVWRALFTLDDGQTSEAEGICGTLGGGEIAGLRWLNEKILDWAEVRHRVTLCRQSWPLVVYPPPPPRPWWLRLGRWFRLWWGPIFPRKCDMPMDRG